MLGGVLSGLLGWRAVFLVNVPVCLAAAALAPRLLRERRGAGGPESADLAGAVTATAGLTALVLGLTVHPAALVAAFALLAAFVRIERRAADPLLDLGALKRQGAVPRTSSRSR